jgi:hypothetical protein
LSPRHQWAPRRPLASLMAQMSLSSPTW